MNKLRTVLSRENSGLHGAAVLLAGATLISQLLGLVRDRLLAGTFGAGQTLDLYYAAFRIPDLLFIGIGSLLAVTVLVPLLVELLEGKDHERLQRFLSSMFTVFTLLLIVAAAIAFVLMPVLAKLVAPGFDAGEQIQLVHLSRILLLSPLLLGLSNLFGSVTQARRQFLLYSISPILYNLGIISGVVVFYPISGISGLVYGVVLGALLHLGVQLVGSLSSSEERVGGEVVGRVGSPTSSRPEVGLLRFGLIDWPAVRLVLSRSIPRAIAMGANQISLLVLIAYASHLVAGSIAVFNLSYNLQSVPMALIGVSYSVAAFPTMVRHLAAGKREFLAYMQGVMRHVLFLSIPIATLFIVLREEIVRTILGSGKFGPDAIHTAALLLSVFAIAVVFQNVVLLFDRSYYAAGKTLVPVITNIIGTIVAISSGYYFIWIAPLSSSLDHIVLGLPLAFALGITSNMIAEGIWYHRDFGSLFAGGVKRTIGEGIVASAVMGVVSYLVLQVIARYAPTITSVQALAHGALAGVAGILAALAVLLILGSEELKTFTQILRRRFRGTSLSSSEERD